MKRFLMLTTLILMLGVLTCGNASAQRICEGDICFGVDLPSSSLGNTNLLLPPGIGALIKVNSAPTVGLNNSQVLVTTMDGVPVENVDPIILVNHDEGHTDTIANLLDMKNEMFGEDETFTVPAVQEDESAP